MMTTSKKAPGGANANPRADPSRQIHYTTELERMQGLADRLARIVPEKFDGELWWPMANVCDAFRTPRSKCNRVVCRKNKRRRFVFSRNYRQHYEWYINRNGIEVLAICYGQEPREKILSALQGGGIE